MHQLRPVAPLLVLAVAPIALADSENLVLNGDFERGPTVGDYLQLNAPSARIGEWFILAGSVDYIGSYWQPADGRRSVDLSGAGPGVIAQSIYTQPGMAYTVRFKLAGNPIVGGVKHLRVSAAGQRAEFTFDTTGRGRQNMGWVEHEWTFIADWDIVQLEFESLTPTGAGPALDAVSVAADNCRADHNGDGFVDFFDMDAFVFDFERAADAADFNRDGFIDFFDLDEFVAAFDAGC